MYNVKLPNGCGFIVRQGEDGLCYIERKSLPKRPGVTYSVSFSDTRFYFEREIVNSIWREKDKDGFTLVVVTRDKSDDCCLWIEKISYKNVEDSFTSEILGKATECPFLIFNTLYAYKTIDGKQGLIDFKNYSSFVGDDACSSYYMQTIKESVSIGATHFEVLPIHDNDSVVTFIVIKHDVADNTYLEQVVVDRRLIPLSSLRRYRNRSISSYVDVEYLAPGTYRGMHVDEEKGLSIVNVSGIYGNKQGIVACHVEKEIRTHLKNCGRSVVKVVSNVFPSEGEKKLNERELVVFLDEGVSLYFAMLVDENDPNGYRIANKYFERVNNSDYPKFLTSKLGEDEKLDRHAFWNGLDKIKFDGGLNRFGFNGTPRNDGNMWSGSIRFFR